MKEIEVTMERTQRISHMFEIPDSVYEEIKRTREIPTDMFERMEEILDDSSADIEYDYAVWSETEQKQLIDWQ